MASAEELELALAPSVTVYTTRCTAVHRRGASGATAPLFQRLAILELGPRGTALVSVTPMKVHHPNYLESRETEGFGQGGTAAPCPVPPSPLSGDQHLVFSR